MTLELAALAVDVQALSLASVEVRARHAAMLETARARLATFASDLEQVRERVQLTRDRNLHWRGAFPVGEEPLDSRHPLPALPSQVNIIANDGSQVPIDPHGAALYYAINIGYIVYPYGRDEPPTVQTAPSLHFREDELFEGARLISNAQVNARRTVREMENLANLAEVYGQMGPPLALLSDGPLLWMPPGDTPHQRQRMLKPYLDQLERVKQAGVAIGGYVDRPRSSGVLRLLHLLSVERVTTETVAQHDLVGLTDAHLFATLLGPGERSALFARQSPTNRDYAEAGHEVWFCYINVGTRAEQPLIARLEMPAWVAGRRDRRDLLHAVIWQQCQVVGGYPYVLARAHELALISTDERRDLDEMVVGALRRQGLDVRPSEKARQKGLTGGAKRRHRL